MKTIKRTLLSSLVLSASAVVFSSSVMAAAGIGDLPMVVGGGTMACTGVQMNSLNKTHYRLANFNETASITVKRMRVYDPSGTLRLDYPAVNAFPANFRSTLAPHQTTVWQSEGAFGDTQVGPLQVVVDFSLNGAKGFALHGLTTRLVDNLTTGEEVTRSDEGCHYLKFTK
jgi:hypothetical protein